MRLESPSFTPGSEIPRAHANSGALSPPLSWSELPRATRSLAVIVEDLDTHDRSAPDHAFVHWVVYDIQASEPGLPPGISAADLDGGASLGLNSAGEARYAGPCPAAGTGTHRYAFRLYALDVMLRPRGAATATQLRRQMDGHVLDVAELIGTFAARV